MSTKERKRPPKPTKEQREAQSRRDKAKHRAEMKEEKKSYNPPRRSMGRSRASNMPASVGSVTTTSGSNFMNLGPLTHSESGLSGDRFRFRQPLPITVQSYCTGTTPVAGQDYVLAAQGNSALYAQSGYIYTATSTPGVNVSTGFFLNPLYMGLRLYAIANLYSNYVFRKLTIRYCPVMGTAQQLNTGSTAQNAGQIAMALSMDPYIWPENGAGETTGPQYVQVASTSPGVQFPYWGSTGRPVEFGVSYTGNKVWYNEVSQATLGEGASDLRVEHQYRMCAMSTTRAQTAATVGFLVYGYLEVEGVVDFLGPVSGVSTAGFTLSSTRKLTHQRVIDEAKKSPLLPTTLVSPRLDSEGDWEMGVELKSLPSKPATTHTPRKSSSAKY